MIVLVIMCTPMLRYGHINAVFAADACAYGVFVEGGTELIHDQALLQRTPDCMVRTATDLCILYETSLRLVLWPILTNTHVLLFPEGLTLGTSGHHYELVTAV